MGCIMSKCLRCNVNILDDTEKCPLCRNVITKDNSETINAYPNARTVTRRFRLFENIVLFISLVTTFAVILTDQLVSGNMDWSLIVVFILLYINVLIRLAIVGRAGYIFKTVFMVVAAVLVLWAIDYSTGYRGWSVNIILPLGIILMDVAILILMIVNRRNWQSYIMLQLFTILVSIIPVAFVMVNLITFPYFAIAAMAFSLVIFLGTLIIGDQRARTEIKRRFYI